MPKPTSPRSKKQNGSASGGAGPELPPRPPEAVKDKDAYAAWAYETQCEAIRAGDMDKAREHEVLLKQRLEVLRSGEKNKGFDSAEAGATRGAENHARRAPRTTERELTERFKGADAARAIQNARSTPKSPRYTEKGDKAFFKANYYKWYRSHGDWYHIPPEQLEVTSFLSELLEEENDRPTTDLPGAIDLRELAKTEPPPPRFIVANWMPQGEVTLLSGHGGTGKSMMVLYLAVCIARGHPWYGIPTERRRVLYLSLEDPKPILHWRLSRICDLEVSIADLHESLHLFDWSDSAAPMMIRTRDGAQLTDVYERLRKCIEESKADVIIIDGGSDAFGGNENDRAEVRAFVRAVRRLIPPDGAALILAHVDKATAKAGESSQGYSGSTAWNNSVRSRWFLRSDDDGGMLIELQRIRDAASGAQIRLRWNDSAKMFNGGLETPPGGLEREIMESEERATLVRLIGELAAAGNPVPTAHTGPRTAFHVMVAHPNFPPQMRSKGRFWAAIETLRQTNRIRVGKERTASRHDRPVFLAGAAADGSRTP